MLTEQERKWLEERKKRTQHCDTCPNRVGYYELCSSCRSRSLYGLSLCPDYRDAAEFEARVAAKLAEHAGSGGRRGGIGTLLRPHGCSWYNADGYRETVCPSGHDIDKCTGIPFCNLYLARIAVEQEMDDELE